jgi:hypothetical protein
MRKEAIVAWFKDNIPASHGGKEKNHENPGPKPRSEPEICSYTVCVTQLENDVGGWLRLQTDTNEIMRFVCDQALTELGVSKTRSPHDYSL